MIETWYETRPYTDCLLIRRMFSGTDGVLLTVSEVCGGRMGDFHEKDKLENIKYGMLDRSHLIISAALSCDGAFRISGGLSCTVSLRTCRSSSWKPFHVHAFESAPAAVWYSYPLYDHLCMYKSISEARTAPVPFMISLSAVRFLIMPDLHTTVFCTFRDCTAVFPETCV